jgi:transposase
VLSDEAHEADEASPSKGPKSGPSGRADTIAIEHLESAATAREAQLEAITSDLCAAGSSCPTLSAKVRALRCFRGIQTLTAVNLVAELHGIARFPSPRSLMAHVGLVPREHSSGKRIRRGSITKSGNPQVRRLLVQAAWHYRHKPKVGPSLAQRRTAQPRSIVTLADQAQRRLHSRYVHLAEKRRLPKKKVIIAVARELTGFIWSALRWIDEHHTS